MLRDRKPQGWVETGESCRSQELLVDQEGGVSLMLTAPDHSERRRKTMHVRYAEHVSEHDLVAACLTGQK